MVQGQARKRDRVKAAIAVAIFHALLGYAFITGLAYEVVNKVGERLEVFDIPDPPPPPEEKPEPVKPKTAEPEGAAAPKSMPAIVAPKPEIPLPVTPKVQTAPASGTSNVPGEGTGSGGTGTGTGSGGSGSGTGGGGGDGGEKAQRIRGNLAYNDLPRSARERSARGTVGVRFIVQPDGRVTGCSVTRPSGDPDLDGTTCRIIERRFRYRPARNAQGQPVAETVTTSFEWVPNFRF